MTFRLGRTAYASAGVRAVSIIYPYAESMVFRLRRTAGAGMSMRRAVIVIFPRTETVVFRLRRTTCASTGVRAVSVIYPNAKTVAFRLGRATYASASMRDTVIIICPIEIGRATVRGRE